MESEAPKTDDQTPPKKSSIQESIEFVVNMMNSGQANPKDVYPGGHNRYHGD